MQESLNKINTSLEARKLVKDPTKLFSLLYSKYGDVREDYYTSFINQIMYKCSSHFHIQYKEIQYNDFVIEFLRRFYKKKEVKDRIPNLYEYYKNYHLFYLKPILRNFYLENIMHNYQDKKAEIFYKNNYTRTTNEKNISDDNSITSSLSSSDHYTNNKIIFNTKTKLILDGKNNNSSNSNSSFMYFNISKIKKINNLNENLRLSIKTNDENTLNELMKELKNDNKNNNNNNDSKSKKKNNKTKTQRNSRKNNSPKIHSKSPTFQIHHQIQVIKSTNNNLNNNYNLISPQMYILSQKNSYSKKKNNSHKNKIYFSPKSSCYFNNVESRIEEMFKKYQNYFIHIRQKRNKTGNNSNNNTIKKHVNNNNNVNNNINSNIFGTSNFQSNFKKFSKLSASLKNNRFNLTYFSQINSNNNSRSSMSGKKSSKLQKNKKVIKEKNQNQSNNKTKIVKHKKNKTFDFNAVKGKYVELKKNYTNYNLLRFRPSPQNIHHSKVPIGLNFNIMKSPKNDVILRNSQGSNGHSQNKRYINRKNQNVKKSKKSFISIASCSSPKFSFIISKNETNVKESFNNNNNLNNIDNNIYNFLNYNKKIITKLRKNKHKKNNISYTNNNFNINFNNVYFCSSRPTSGQHSNNIISDNINTNGNVPINKNINNNNYNINNVNNLTNNNSINLNKKQNPLICHKNNNCNTNISNLYVKSLNNIYNISRNKNYKISNCSHTQTQSQSIAKNSKIIKISESKIPVNKTNSFILHCNNKNIIDDKTINKIQKKYKRSKMINQIEDLIMKSKKNIKFGSEHKNKIGTIISNKPAFNNCNNKSKNQTQNKSNYHEMFIKNLKRASSTSIKVNTKSVAGNNKPLNPIYKK